MSQQISPLAGRSEAASSQAYQAAAMRRVPARALGYLPSRTQEYLHMMTMKRMMTGTLTWQSCSRALHCLGQRKTLNMHR